MLVVTAMDTFKSHILANAIVKLPSLDIPTIKANSNHLFRESNTFKGESCVDKFLEDEIVSHKHCKALLQIFEMDSSKGVF